jgi:transposase
MKEFNTEAANADGGAANRASCSSAMKYSPKTLNGRSSMSTIEAASKVLEEIAQLFGSGPTDEQILNFRPSADVAQRASQLLSLNRPGQMDDEVRHELDQYEQAELLMRMVKAQIRSRQGS